MGCGVKVGPSSKRLISVNAVKGTIKVSILAILLGMIAPQPVQSLIKLSPFFGPSEKYQQWYHETTWLQDARTQKRAGWFRSKSLATSTAVRYPYPEKKFEMTKSHWTNSTKSIIDGGSDWYDSEIVRQRAEVEEHPPAMEFLAWMYQEGQGLDKDLRKAFMWYERAKMAGVEDLTAPSAKTYHRLNERDKYFAELQLIEDIEQVKSGNRKGKFGKSGYKNYKSVNLGVMKEQRDPDYFKRKKRRLAQLRKNGG